MGHEREDVNQAYQAVIQGQWENKFSAHPKIDKLFLSEAIRWHKKLEHDFKDEKKHRVGSEEIYLTIARSITVLFIDAEREILSNQAILQSPKVTEQRMKLTAKSLGKAFGYFLGAIRFGLGSSRLFNVNPDYIKTNNFGILRAAWSFGSICKQEGINLEILSRQVGIIGGEMENKSGKFLTKKIAELLLSFSRSGPSTSGPELPYPI